MPEPGPDQGPGDTPGPGGDQYIVNNNMAAPGARVGSAFVVSLSNICCNICSLIELPILELI